MRHLLIVLSLTLFACSEKLKEPIVGECYYERGSNNLYKITSVSDTDVMAERLPAHIPAILPRVEGFKELEPNYHRLDCGHVFKLLEIK